MRYEERMRVLKMIENGQITAHEGMRLLELLGERDGEPPAETPGGAARAPRRLRVLVTDLGTQQRKVDISLPWSLVSVGINMGASFTPPGLDIDLEEVLSAVKHGAEGKIMDVVDPKDNERVEIFVEHGT